jgi:broad specificity phosphatase PhoE
MLFIRHGEKEYINGGSSIYPLDPDLTEEGKQLAYDKFLFLINKYHIIPDTIITSPYLRTRRTATIAQQVIYDITGINVLIICDNFLSEFLNNNEYHDVIMEEAVRPETLQYKPIPPETYQEYKKRMYVVSNSKVPNVFYITHGFNITTIALLKGYHVEHPKELCGIMIHKNGIIEQI